jgi:iron complex outermembrane receptor protein
MMNYINLSGLAGNIRGKGTVLAALVLISGVAGAQAVPSASADNAAPKAADVGGLEEITVTARYTKENLQNTPVAITAVSQDQLKLANVTNMTSLGAMVPNLYTHPGDADEGGSPVIVMRGVVENDASYAREPAVGIYVDDVYHSTVVGSALNLNDIDHIEVKRGPQGTLSGNASIGGTISIFSKVPQGDDTGYIEATYGSFHKEQIDAAFDVALMSNLFLRVSGSQESQDGYVTLLDFACEMYAQGTPQLIGNYPHSTPGGVASNGATQLGAYQRGCKTGSEGGTNQDAVKAMLRWLPQDGLEINYQISYHRNRDEASPELITSITNPYPNSNALIQNYNVAMQQIFNIQYDNRFLAPKGQPYSSYATFCRPGFGGTVVQQAPYEPVPNGYCYANAMNMDSFDNSLKIDWDVLDKVHMKAIFAASEFEDTTVQNGDESPLGYVLSYFDQPVKQYTAEVRFNGLLFDDKFKWVTGGYYLTSRAESNGAIGYITDNFTETDTAFKHTASGFLHGDYAITDRWNVSGGTRFSWDELQYRLNHPGLITVTDPFTVSANRFDWLASTDYKITDNTMAYFTFATGSRPPGITTIVITAAQLSPYTAEVMHSYEFGLKNEFFDHRVRFNADVFYSDYKSRLATEQGVQCLGQPGAPTWAAYQTACNGYANTSSVPWYITVGTPAVIEGAEWELTAKPTERLLVSWTGGYNHFKSLVRDPMEPGYNAAGNLQQPEWNMNAGIQYSIPVFGAGDFTPRMDWSYQTRQTFAPNTTIAPDPAFNLPAQSIYNASFIFKPTDGKWTATVQVTNLFDKFYYYQLFNGGAVNVSSNVAPPREFNVRLRRDF